MLERFGFVVDFAAPPTDIEALVEKHDSWYIKRYNRHRWEVRTGLNDKNYYGETLTEAFCYALLDMP